MIRGEGGGKPPRVPMALLLALTVAAHAPATCSISETDIGSSEQWRLFFAPLEFCIEKGGSVLVGTVLEMRGICTGGEAGTRGGQKGKLPWVLHVL